MIMVGTTVLYHLDAHDAARVNQRRADFARFQAHHDNHKHPHDPISGGSGASGHVAHIGLEVAGGQALPARTVIVNPSGTLCLRVELPGNDIQWVENVPQGDGPGHWKPLP